MKKTLKITGFVILGLFLLLLIIPVLFKGPIVEAFKTEINKQIDATVQFEDVSLSLIRNFPNLNLRVSDLTITGKDEFEGRELVRADRFGFVFNLSSLWKKDKPYEVKSLDIDGMDLYMVTLSNGKANYMILKESEMSESEVEDSEFAFDLNAYHISNSRIVWDDKSTNTHIKMEDFNHSGRGNFTSDQFEWGSQTDIEKAFVSYGGVPYLSGVEIDWDIDLEVDMVERSLRIIQNSLLVNLLQLDLQGMVLFPENENLFLDIAVNAPGNDFVELFSVLPMATLTDINDLVVRGDFDFSAFAKGEFNSEEELYPPFGLDLKVNDGFVQYPDMDIPMENIFIDLNANSPTSDLDQMEVDVSAFSLNMGQNPIAGKLFLTRLMSNPRVVAEVDGRVDLGDISRVFPMEGINRLNGMIAADLNAAFNWSDIDEENYERITLSGIMNMQNIELEWTDLPAISIPHGGLELSERNTIIRKTKLLVGSSDFEAEGETNNILKLWGTQSPLTGQINLRSTHFDVDEMMNLFDSAEEEEDIAVADSGGESPRFFNVDLNIKTNAQEVIFRPYFISDISSEVNLKPHLITLRNTSLVINESDLSGNVAIENWYAFAMVGERMTVDANLRGGTLDLDKLMANEEDGSAAGISEEDELADAPSVPDFKYNIHLSGAVNKIVYRPYELENVITEAYITERDLHIEQFSGNIYGDKIEGDGFIGNYMRYVYLDEVLTGELNFRAASLDLNKWMEAMVAEETGTAESEVDLDEMEPFEIPQNLDIAINGRVGKLDYFNMPFREVSGIIEMVEGALQIKDFTGNLFRGKMVINGLYESANENPFLNMKLDIESLDIPSTFQHINTIAEIGPLFQFMNGQFNSTVALNTSLGSGMMPLWNTFNAEGFIKTLNAQINDFPALSKAADQLQLDFLRKLKLDDIENWFQVEGGRFELKPVSHTIEDTDFEFSGSHLIAGDMNYLLEASIPKELIGRSTVGAGAVKGLDFLQSEASKLGVNIGGGTHVDVGIRLTGKLRNPGVAIELLGVSTGKTAGEQVEDAVRDRVEEEREKAEERVREEVEEVKEKVEEKVKKELDSLRDIAGANEEELRKKERELREKAQKEAEDLLKDMQKDTTGKNVEDIKDRIKKFNPFKRGSDDG